jgi:hypothetical protein
VCSDGRIFLETYSPIYKQVCGASGMLFFAGSVSLEALIA